MIPRTVYRATRHALTTLLGALLTALTIVALVAVSTQHADAAAVASARRPKPTTTVTAPTPTPTATPTPTPTPTPPAEPSPVDCATITWEGTAYCPVFIRELLNDLRPAGSPVVVLDATVVGAAESTLTVMGATWCQPGMWCGQLLDVMDVTFPAGAALPAYGDVVNLYGAVISGGLAPDGFIVIGHCDAPDLDC